MFRKKSSILEKRIKKIRRELSSVNSNIRSLSKQQAAPSDDENLYEAEVPAPAPRRVQKREAAASAQKPEGEKVGPQEEVRLEDLRNKIHDERFVDYLSSSFEGVRPLRYERRIQRNRTIIKFIVVVIVIIILVYKFFL